MQHTHRMRSTISDCGTTGCQIEKRRMSNESLINQSNSSFHFLLYDRFFTGENVDWMRDVVRSDYTRLPDRFVIALR